MPSLPSILWRTGWSNKNLRILQRVVLVRRIFQYVFVGKSPGGTLVSRKPITPTEKELAENRRSRSAKLRIVEKNQEK